MTGDSWGSRVNSRGALRFAHDAFGRSKVGRRVTLLFIGCALLPICCLAVVAYVQVTNELHDVGQRRLAQIAKTAGVDLFDKLIGLDAELDLFGNMASSLDADGWSTLPPALRERFTQRLSGLAVVRDNEVPRPIFGPMPPSAEIGDAAWAHMRDGNSVLTVEAASGAPPRIVLTRMLDAKSNRGLLIAQIDRNFLFSADLAPPQIDLVVLGSELLFSSLSPEKTHAVSAHRPGADSSTGRFEWSDEEQSYAASFWSIPMTFNFQIPGWTIVATQANAEVLAPIRDTRVSFTLIALLSLWLVMLLSISQVRRYLVPLQMLADNTARVGRGDFEGHLDIRSGDEFEDVAASFNTMSTQLKRHFEALSARGELDRAVLSSLEIPEIVSRVLDWLPRLLHGDAFAVIVLDKPPMGSARAFARAARGALVAPAAKPVEITAEQATELTSSGRWIRVTRDNGGRGHLSLLDSLKWTSATLLPIESSSQLVGVLAMADSAQDRPDEDLRLARQLADQMGVALANASLVATLDRLNVGTLMALARTVDANSPWTAGHSQRVTDIATAIARTMGFSPSDLDRLARGSLLHDIGKIAVPSSILNKPGKLTPEEFTVMQQHPVVGARILEPIPDYDRLIPVVLQHHERFDGRGYPAGLSGEMISLDARIVAVADVFDALTSERPYRKALDEDAAMRIIVNGRASEFDPAVVDAFLRLPTRTHAA